MYYINYFFIMSIVGHFIETIFNNGNSGILYGYWTPIYGIGTIIILYIYKYINKCKLGQFSKIITLFLCSAIILSTIEALGGYLIKFIFDKELWNYTNHSFSIGKYTSLEMAVIWGISSVVLIYLIKPIVDKFVVKIPRIFSLVLISIFIIDLIATLVLKA